MSICGEQIADANGAEWIGPFISEAVWIAVRNRFLVRCNDESSGWIERVRQFQRGHVALPFIFSSPAGNRNAALVMGGTGRNSSHSLGTDVPLLSGIDKIEIRTVPQAQRSPELLPVCGPVQGNHRRNRGLTFISAPRE